MSNQVRVEIGGIGLLFRCKDCQIKESRNSGVDIRDFIRLGKNDFIIEVEVGRLPEYPKDRMLFEAGENWRLYADQRRYIFETYQSQRKGGNEEITRICVMEKDLSRANVYISPGTDSTNNSRTWSLRQLMRIMGQLITISILHLYQGLLIHSLGIMLNGEGIIFPGISGAGKTTLAGLCQVKTGATVLSDDRIIVRRPSCVKPGEARQREGYFVYGSPWPGEGKTASCQKTPLKKILFLSKADRNKLTPLGKRESFHQLITQCFPAIWDKENIDFTLKFCRALVENIPCFSFGFIPDESAVTFIEENR